MALVVDTGPLFASVNRADNDHARCLALLSNSREPIVIPAPVLVEVDQLGLRLDPQVMAAFWQDLADGAMDVEDLRLEDYGRISEITSRYADARVGFVDAAVLAVVERLGEPKLATLDRRHFSLLRPRHVDALHLLPD